MAKFTFNMPDIGEGIAEAEIVQWHKQVGDTVNEDEEFVDMMTDKATVPMESPVTGKILEIAGGEGDMVSIGSMLVVIEVEGEVPDDVAEESQAAAEAAPAPEPAPAPKAEAPKPAEEEKPAAPAPVSRAKQIIPAGQPLPPQPSANEIDPAALAKVSEVEKKAKKLSLMELTERTCKWPVGDPATEDFWFCGLPVQSGKPYCEAHVGVAFQPMSNRRDRRR